MQLHNYLPVSSKLTFENVIIIYYVKINFLNLERRRKLQETQNIQTNVSKFYFYKLCTGFFNELGIEKKYSIMKQSLIVLA